MATTTQAQTRIEHSESRRTEFHTKVAAELWLNIGGKEFRLVGKSIRLGRAADNDIVLDHKSCSRYHALITLQGDRVILEDLKSRNGVRLQGEVVRRAALKDNDQIQIGDLVGVFFQRTKRVSTQPQFQILSKLSEKLTAAGFEQISHMAEDIVDRSRNKWESMDKKKRIFTVGAGVLSLFIVWSMIFGGKNTGFVTASSTLESYEAIVETPTDKRAFEKCLELEDLGNFRQAYSCFRNLPLTADVSSALKRIQAQQTELAEKRFVEGTQAFENYYYDIAILKWQEVLLISADSSEYRLKAVSGIQKAEERKKLR
ncbi:MAG: FHA domain-containing protein [Deltaproteobacteria bacterium]|nr:FHA domain-containing protein [Deltaproteobacteria bacterium]